MVVHELPPLPYPKNALEPYISAETIEFHYGKHHNGYVNKLNQVIKGTSSENLTLEEIIKTRGVGFNVGAQAWNHTFYWKSMTPNGGGNPTGKLLDAINNSFGNFETFKTKFSEVAAGHFGSGWAWLVREPNSNKLEIMDTHDADNPLTHGKVPILACDVWEHAYYIDYRNDRAKYVNNWWMVVNWKFAESNLL